MVNQVGPTRTVRLSCFDCVHCKSSRYQVQGDSGSDVWCDHPQAPTEHDIGDTTWATPTWCPVLITQALS
jgi:hypothetical protein